MAKSTNPFRYFDSSPEVIRLLVLMYVKLPVACPLLTRRAGRRVT